jgi:hypothetical protein
MLLMHIAMLPLVLAAEPKLTFEGAPHHPIVYVTPADVERARERVVSDADAKAWFESLAGSAAAWADKDAAWVARVMPPKGACFAYGFTGCPICASTWGTWGSANATFDKPGHVRCAKGHLLPDAAHPDAGTGFVAKDGRIHYFVGSYNAWVVETLLFKVAVPYATVYLLKGDDRAGRTAAVVLDHIAAIYPSCDKGSWDYPSNPPSGRLDRPWYQVARVLVYFVDVYDRIYAHPVLDEPSCVPGLSRRQNIEQNLLLNGAKYCYDMSVKHGALHNGQADYLRGVLAVGVLLGIPEYIRWPVDGPYGIRTMLVNNVDRDGGYFETSVGYGLHTRNLYLPFAEPLLNYRGSVFSHGLNLYDSPRFESFLLLPQMSLTCLGHDAPFGDAAPIITRSELPYSPPRVFDCVWAEYLATRVSDQSKRDSYLALLSSLRSRDPNSARQTQDTAEWRTFHGMAGPASQPATLDRRWSERIEGSFVLGQKGLAVMRLGEGDSAHAAILRFGPSLNHGHLDDLNVNYFARGYELTYDIGYSLGSTHTQVGWAKQTASHNAVIVDEKSHGGGTSGGSLHHFACFPGLVMAEGSSTVYEHKGVGVYRRLVAMADSYALDVFRVSGGKRHDLPIHSLSTDVVFDKLAFGPVRTGSLAGPEYRWGELQLNDGDMQGFPNKPYWNPPPGNGYGFMVQPAVAQPEGNWSATWTIGKEDVTRFRIEAVKADGEEIATAVAPGLYPHFPKSRYVVRRRAGESLSSCFVSVWHSASGLDAMPVRSVRRIDGGETLSADSSFALAVDTNTGQTDLWGIGLSPNAVVTCRDGKQELALQGCFARGRLARGELVSAELVDGRSFKVGGWMISLDTPSRVAKVAENPSGDGSILLDDDWPDDGRYLGATLYVSNPRYSRNSAYTIAGVDKSTLRVSQTGTFLGRGTVETVPDDHTLTTRVPHEYARWVGGRNSGFFQGKLLRTEDGVAFTHIREIVSGEPLTVKVDSTGGLEPGQAFVYRDVQGGDRVTVHHWVRLTRVANNQYQLRTNTDVTIAPPGGAAVRFTDRSGQSRLAVDGHIPRRQLPTNEPADVFVGR